MRTFGVLLCIGALIALVLGFSFDTSVSTGLGRVHNLGLMNEKQNIIIVGGAMLIAGALLLAITGREQSQPLSSEAGYRKCPNCAEFVKSEAKVCRFCQRELPSLLEIEALEEADRKRLADSQARAAEEARQIEDRLPKGVCPNCDAIIPLSSLKCKHCDAHFGPGSAWSVLPKNEA
jgi:RNA polymerase subunit RPABC4/transcription elongation factor Spt4